MKPKRWKLTPFVPTELSEQIVVFEWAKLRETQHPPLALLHASLNGLRLNIGQAVKAKRAGMRAGVPDIFLPFPVERDGSVYHGLYLELKRRSKGTFSAEQKWWMTTLIKFGYCVRAPKGATEAITEICWYLNIQP